MSKKGAFVRLAAGLRKSSKALGRSLSLALGGRVPDAQSLELLEEALILADLGPKLAARLCSGLSRRKFSDTDVESEVRVLLAREIAGILRPVESVWSAGAGDITIFVGVNGAGKTTSIGKIASRLSSQGQGVTIGACDSFRAAATEQLQVWSERAGAHFVSGEPGANAAGLAFEAVRTGQARGDCVLIDTAGRLQNRAGLMDELSRIVRAARKALLQPQSAEPNVILVLDAGTGWNALAQAEGFQHAVGVTGIVMTRLDGTARGGVLVALAERTGLPVHFIGTGEGVEDLHPFDAEGFASALLEVAV